MSTNALLNCHFTVQWGGTRLGFMEVTGLEIAHEVVEFREGSSPDFAIRKMPGLAKYTNIVLKRGIVRGDNEFYNWINTTQLNTVEKRDVVISLLNERHEPVAVWKAKNAFPVKVTGPTLHACGNEVAIETLELAHDGLTIEMP